MLGREKFRFPIIRIVQVFLEAAENACDKGIAVKCKGAFRT